MSPLIFCASPGCPGSVAGVAEMQLEKRKIPVSLTRTLLNIVVQTETDLWNIFNLKTKLK